MMYIDVTYIIYIYIYNIHISFIFTLYKLMVCINNNVSQGYVGSKAVSLFSHT